MRQLLEIIRVRSLLCHLLRAVEKWKWLDGGGPHQTQSGVQDEVLTRDSECQGDLFLPLDGATRCHY